MHRRLVWLLLSPLTVHALGVPKTCPLKSQEIKLARECFSGDMRANDDFGTFLGTEESKDDLNFCYNAFVIVHPKKGGELQFSVLKDNEKGKLAIYNYAVPEKQITAKAQAGRMPASKAPAVLTFKNLKAECYANKAETDKCSKGVFGFGSTDLPLTIELTKGKGGYVVKGATKDAAVIGSAAEGAIEPKTMGDQAKTNEWLLQVVKQRLLTTAQRKLASAGKVKKGAPPSQFRYCRMALDGYVHQRKIPSPFNEKEVKLLDNAEEHLK
ncbi:MAG: hypothetical protein KF799_13680 [Bdellovibrionales bacterium]|nr:hypothetical protein [Bdellovibrionales bacterium]